MFYRKNWIAGIVVVLGLVMFVPVAQAQRQEFEYVSCGANTYNVVHYTPEMAIMSYDGKWINCEAHLWHWKMEGYKGRTKG